MKTGTMKKIYSLTAALLAATIVMAAGNPATDVELSVEYRNNTACISWKPASGKGILRYELQKSTDGVNFSYFCAYAATIPAYRVEDSNLISHTQYYRLKLVDEAGQSLYSAVKGMDLKAIHATLKILPGTSGERMWVWLPVNTRILSAAITDARGQVLLSDLKVKNNVNMAAVETGILEPGAYQLLVTTNRGDRVQLRFNRN